MHETFFDKGASRAERYGAVLSGAKSLLGGESDAIANLANVAALLKEAMGFFWVGFYRRMENGLVLGPFQGSPACTRIPLDAGVCGACARRKQTIIVPNVDEFEGHIACSSLSKSEIVVPLVQNGEVRLVLDIDSTELNDFGHLDQQCLEALVALIAARHPNETYFAN